MASGWRSFERRNVVRFAALAAAAAVGLTGVYLEAFFSPTTQGSMPSAARAAEPPAQPTTSGAADRRSASVTLNDQQLKNVTVETVEQRLFGVTREAVGNIDFDQDNSLQVFTPYPGRIVKLWAKAGDDVKKGQVLFEIDSPDLTTAEGTLIQAAAQLELTSKALKRAQALFAAKGAAQKDVEQAISDYKTAEGNYDAARTAVRIFGKTEAEINQLIAAHRIDPLMPVPSPIDGRVTARNAAVGLYVQPGNTPAPYTVSDISTMWMLASVPEADIPLLRLGDDVEIHVAAYPGRIFKGKIVNIGAAVDPNTHRIQVRSHVKDPQHELRAQMFATFVIRTGEAVKSPGVRDSGIVREGDGTMTVWVTTDGNRFTQRTVKIGLLQDGFWQVLAGLKPGERVATDGALFLDNAVSTAAQD
jgi:cobalt-zinc-cadmium efflux system membrane fusion protein